MLKSRIPQVHGDIWPRDLITVYWSNGAGYSVYRIVDTPSSGGHALEWVEDYEFDQQVDTVGHDVHPN